MVIRFIWSPGYRFKDYIEDLSVDRFNGSKVLHAEEVKEDDHDKCKTNPRRQDELFFQGFTTPHKMCLLAVSTFLFFFHDALEMVSKVVVELKGFTGWKRLSFEFIRCGVYFDKFTDFPVAIIYRYTM